MSGKLPNVSIGDFAESLLNGGQTQGLPIQESQSFSTSPTFGALPLPAPGQIDISNVQVPENFVASIVEGKEPEIKQRVPLVENSGDRLEVLLSRLCSLLEETKSLISEMTMGSTGSGSIGTTAAPTYHKKKVKRRKKPIKRVRTVESTIESVLKDLENGNI